MSAFVLTFMAEWGDRSQIATIILGAREVRPTLLLREREGGGEEEKGRRNNKGETDDT